MAKFNIILQRIKAFSNIKKPKCGTIEGSTLGEFIVFNDKNERVLSCYSIENAGPSTDKSGLDRRIVARDYKLYWTDSSVALPKKYGRKCVSLYTDALPSFIKRRIHIHIGNYPQDSLGCILLNYRSLGNGVGSESNKAVEDFYDLIQKEGIANFSLTIKEIV